MKISLLTAENIRKLARILWGAVLLTLPVTSFRYFPGLGSGEVLGVWILKMD